MFTKGPLTDKGDAINGEAVRGYGSSRSKEVLTQNETLPHRPNDKCYERDEDSPADGDGGCCTVSGFPYKLLDCHIQPFQAATDHASVQRLKT